MDNEPPLEATTFTAKSSTPGLPKQPASPRRTSRIVSPVMSVLEREANAISSPDGLALPDRDATRANAKIFLFNTALTGQMKTKTGYGTALFQDPLAVRNRRDRLREPTEDGGPDWGIAGSFSIELRTLHAVHHLSYLVSHSIARAFR